MFKLLYPNQHLNSIFELKPDELQTMGIRGIIVDMDNTLVPWNDRTVQPRLADWLSGLRQSGFRLCIVSNNTADRGEKLAVELGIPAIWHAIKPRRRAFRKAIARMELSNEEVAVIGDQIFTDVLGGNRLGLYTILVTPLSDKEFIGTRLVRRIERMVLGHMRRKK